MLSLDDGASETFTANGQQDFRRFVTTRPVASMTIAAPDADTDGDYVWGVFDTPVAGRAR